MFVREIGTGAGTRVALMRDVKDGRQYCKKSVAAGSDKWQSQVRQMKNEFDVGVLNEHPVLRKSLEFGIVKRKLRAVEAYIILPYIEGTPLDKFSETSPLSLLLKIFWHAADGLHDLHRRGYVHADLKPQNILCGRNGRPVIIDFGQACRIHTRKPRIQGTSNFIAPEQVERKPLDARTDVFGFGATMHKIIIGRPIDTKLNAKDVDVSKIGRVTQDFWKEPGSDEPQPIDPALLKLMGDCCKEDWAQRPESMQLVKDRLELLFHRLAKTASAS